MANLEKQNKFVALRAEGKSFTEISKAISVSKPTLIKWSKELKDKIDEIASELEDSFRTEQRLKRTLRARLLAEELDNAYKALSMTDYEKLSKKELIGIIEKLEDKLDKITKSDVTEDDAYDIVVRRLTVEKKKTKVYDSDLPEE